MKNFDTLERILYANSSNKIIPGLSRISRILERLGNPQNSFRSIHIVGTNGKGSTGAFLSSIFQASGYRTAFYSSPHLVSPGERLLIDGEELGADEWIEAAEEAVKAIMPGEELPSYFELLTACAFLLARKKNIDAGIIEAGLGGRLDATNLLSNCACSVVASISMDHMEYLGPTLQDIAAEKFAVVKHNVPACFVGNNNTLIPMFKDFCARAGAIPFVVSEDARIENVKVTPYGNILDFHAPNLELKEVKTGLIGSYQVQNAALALSAVSCVQNSFPKLTTETIKAGMQKANWPGRLEVISREPLIILDGGHNFDGVKKLCASILELWPKRKFIVIYAAMKDKDYSGCLELLSVNLKPALFASTVPGMPRAAKPDELLQAAKNFTWDNSPEGFDEPVEAVREALKKYDAVIVCGSLYFIGYVKKAKIFSNSKELKIKDVR